MARLLSVNVGLPRDIEWHGRTVHTGIWKSPVQGRRLVRRLNIDGDGQGDLAGHGGEHRAVFVYQIESYRYWQEQLGRTDFVMGQFGENFTIQGWPDDTVCIGDRFQIGGALFEVTQPRVTCYRVGIRVNEPRMPALLTSSNRPGFYFRVLQEGEVGADDEIVKVAEARDRMTIAEVNALLYSPHHPRDQLERALRLEALPLGWRASFEALLKSGSASGNAGLMPQAASHPSAPGFKRLTVTAIDHESSDVVSLVLEDPTGGALPAALAGQYLVVKFEPTAGTPAFYRSYSISAAAVTDHYRISIKLEPNGSAGTYLTQHIHKGDALSVSAPRGAFILEPQERPLVLLSAGIGLTPVLAMLYSLASERSTRQVYWLHAARDGAHHPFAAEVRRLLQTLPNAHGYVCYSRPRSEDQVGKDFDVVGHLSQSDFQKVGIPPDAEVYLCGPNRFMKDMEQELAKTGVVPTQIHREIFNGGESLMPGVVAASVPLPHPPLKDPQTGSWVSFVRSGVAAHWDPTAYRSILELAEACDVPVRWSCRAGVCHNCESGLVTGAVAYEPEPLDAPARGNILICCSQPRGDVAIDL
jgi:ferredoxin-NADP reductase/MOSC domain-containing protein YiiM